MLLNWGNSQGLNALMNSAEFIAGFADKGSGEVDLTLAKGTGSATFTRATTATTVNSAGLIVSVASGTARSYYDPTTLQYLGYLSEGARTNICLQSEALGTTWAAPTGMALAANNTTAPDGATTADKLTDDTATSGHYIEQTGLTFSTATAYTFSAFVKWASGTRNIFLQFYTNAGADQAYVILNSSGVVATSAAVGSMASVSASVKSYPSGWYRVTVTGTTGGTAGAGAVRLGHGNGSSAPPPGYTGNGTDASYWWGAQLEAGSFASTYIPTTTASVTRNDDVLTYPSSGNILGTVGTFYCEATLNPLYSYNTLIAGSTGNRYLASIDSSGAMFSYDGTTAPNQAFGVVANSSKKFGISWGSGRNYAYNGTTSAKAFDGDFDIGPALNVGFESSGVNIMFGTIRNVRIYQTQLSASQLQAVTA